MCRTAIVTIACIAGCGRLNFDAHGIGEPPAPRTIAAGNDFTCALRGGELYCWGGNVFGQLGDGTTERKLTPTRVDVPDAIDVEAGFAHACARDVRGDIWCWGDNALRQLGNGTETPASTPQRVLGLPGPAIDLSLGSEHACVVLEDRSVWCWGDNGSGQLGFPGGSAYEGLDPVRAAIDGVDEVAAGGLRTFTAGHTCARRYGDELWCWGSDYDGQHFLDPGNYDGAVPRYTGLHVATLTSGGGITCAVYETGHFACAGYGYSGSMAGTSRDKPSALGGFVQLDFDAFHGCALQDSGNVYCWGVGDRGQLGDGATRAYTGELTQPILASAAVEIAVGGDHACAVLDTGALQCWGSGRSGQLGDGRGAERAPVLVSAFPGPASSIGTGGQTTCAVDAAGAVFCWGLDLIGDGAVLTPTQITGLPAAGGRIAIGELHACALAGGDVWCWGDDAYGQLGGASSPGPGKSFSGAGDVVAAKWATCSIANDNSVWCWGLKDYGLVASDGSPAPSGATSTDLGGGYYHACARALDGTVQCWGRNAQRQLGSNGGVDSNVPLTVPGLVSIDSVIAGGDHSCALAGNTLACWGDDGTSGGPYATPRVVSTQVLVGGAGIGATCIVDTGGALQCWGHNEFGQLGDGTNIDRDDPTLVLGGITAQSVDIGSHHACALAVGGAIYCWGDNDLGQLGIGTRTAALSPITVP